MIYLFIILRQQTNDMFNHAVLLLLLCVIEFMSVRKSNTSCVEAPIGICCGVFWAPTVTVWQIHGQITHWCLASHARSWSSWCEECEACLHCPLWKEKLGHCCHWKGRVTTCLPHGTHWRTVYIQPDLCERASLLSDVLDMVLSISNLFNI